MSLDKDTVFFKDKSFSDLLEDVYDNVKTKRSQIDTLIKELQQVLTHPYNEQTPELTQKYCQRRPDAFFARGGVSHYSCSS